MVLQRTLKNVCDVKITGESNATGVVQARVDFGKRLVKGYDWTPIGEAARGLIKARLSGLPTGGPYTVSLRVCSSKGSFCDLHTLKDILVGDVWIAGGQSNMQGIGWYSDAEKPNKMVRALFMDDNWGVAKDPIHNIWNAIDPVHEGSPGGKGSPIAGIGPAPAFGIEMHRRTKVPQGIIACAHGGTSMNQWDPALKSKLGNSLYGAMLRRFNTHGRGVKGVIWYQGESDANIKDANNYTERMKNLVRSMRRDLLNPDLLFVAVQIGRFACDGLQDGWNAIQDAQHSLPKTIKKLVMVPSIDLDLDDSIHLSGASQNRLGRRIAQAMCALIGESSKEKLPIMMQKTTMEKNPVSGYTDVIVEFDNVVGSLRSTGRPSGFSIRGSNSEQPIYRIDLKGNKAIIHTTTKSSALFVENSIYYGYGTDPFCNITDEADRSLPAFGYKKLHFQRLRAVTNFNNSPLLSRIISSNQCISDVIYPHDKIGFNFALRRFGSDFCDMHQEIVPTAPQECTLFYSYSFDCCEPMDLFALLGYDGPVKVWLDNREIFCDPNGTNPAIADTARIKLDKLSGRHELMVALGTNEGRAWGLFLRLERCGISEEMLKQTPNQFEMPVWLL